MSLLAISGLLAAPQARAEGEEPQGHLEAGLFGGGHFFSKNGELGVADYPDLVPSLKNSGLLGARLGYALLPSLWVEGELAAIPTSDSLSDASVFVMGWRAHALFHFWSSGRWRPFLAAGVGAHSSFTGRTGVDQVENDTDFALHWGAGLKYDLTPRLSLRGDLRHLLPPSRQSRGVTHDFELQAGLSYRFGGESRPAPPPPEPLDTDEDGVRDEADACPREAEDKDGFQDEDGCPDNDNDQDGVADAADKCVDQAETVNQVDDEDGCPETDEDGDGLLGSKDACPAQAEDKDGFQDEDGCPDNDNDQDGVADAADKCPAELETRNGFQDDDGCADELPKAVQRFTGVITGLQFAAGSDRIQATSYALLDQAVKVLKQYPDVRLEISGHTSSDGNAQANQELPQRRAEAVRKYLLSKGIEASRVTAQGFGSSRPLMPNEARSGREKNRRIEFRVINDAPASGAEAHPK
ncbi:Outer membrane protein A precursor [Hyalangium minutum]|uniref:Internalin n=1 Tax=Hyalangium minutum TaxID=394096 RepID=A0A085WHZ6_9BACT|nr:internalin [Hyalangium minutum]KFE67396.1 Outer membrane protein A precursor [Hyalangium minutum]